MELTCQNIIHDPLWFPCHARFIRIKLVYQGRLELACKYLYTFSYMPYMVQKKPLLLHLRIYQQS